MQLFRNRWIPLVILLLFLSACSGIGPEEASAPRELPPDASAGEVHNAFLDRCFRTPHLRDAEGFDASFEACFLAFGKSCGLDDRESLMACKAVAAAFDSLESAGAKPFSSRLEDQLDLLRLASRRGWVSDGEAATMARWVKQLRLSDGGDEVMRLLHESMPAEATSPLLQQALDVGQHSWEFWTGSFTAPDREEVSYQDILDLIAEMELQQEIMRADMTGQFITGAIVSMILVFGGPVGTGAHFFLTAMASQAGAGTLDRVCTSPWGTAWDMAWRNSSSAPSTPGRSWTDLAMVMLPTLSGMGTAPVGCGVIAVGAPTALAM